MNKLNQIVVIYNEVDTIEELKNDTKNQSVIRGFATYAESFQKSNVVTVVSDDLSFVTVNADINGCEIKFMHESLWVGDYDVMEEKYGNSDNRKNIAFTTLAKTLAKISSLLG